MAAALWDLPSKDNWKQTLLEMQKAMVSICFLAAKMLLGSATSHTGKTEFKSQLHS